MLHAADDGRRVLYPAWRAFHGVRGTLHVFCLRVDCCTLRGGPSTQSCVTVPIVPQRKRFFPREFVDAIKVAPKPKPLEDETPKKTERSRAYPVCSFKICPVGGRAWLCTSLAQVTEAKALPKARA